MNSNSGRWLFVAACVLALAAVVQDYRFDAAATRAHGAIAALAQESASLQVKIAELRGGQIAYLATGQGPEFWMRRVTDLATDVESGLGRLRASVQSPEAGTALNAASSALAELLATDKRARQALAGDQRFLASDIVFAEGLSPTQTLIDSVNAAVSTERASREARQTMEARLRLAILPAVVILLSAAGLVWAQSRHRGSPASEAAAKAQMLRELPPPVKAPSPTPVAAAVRPPAAPALSLDLGEAAEVCVDLARVLSREDVPALLERTATVINASGLVLWVADEGGSSLVPGLWYGYSHQVIAKLGSLDVAADNITSVCYRSGRPQAMPGVGQPGATSATAVSLTTADGCHGVLAAELQVAKPAPESVAIARIVAAQLASMTAPAAMSTDSAVAL